MWSRRRSRWIRRGTCTSPTRARTGSASATGCSAGRWVASGFEPLDLRGPQALVFFAGLAFLTFTAAALLRSMLRRPDGEPGPEAFDLDPYRVAYLNGGARAATDAALTALYARGV